MTTNDDVTTNNLLTDNYRLTEALGKSTAARIKQAENADKLRARVAQLEAENAELRGAVGRLIGLSSNGFIGIVADRKPLTLTDRGVGDGYAADDYDTSHWLDEGERGWG